MKKRVLITLVVFLPLIIIITRFIISYIVPTIKSTLTTEKNTEVEIYSSREKLIYPAGYVNYFIVNETINLEKKISKLEKNKDNSSDIFTVLIPIPFNTTKNSDYHPIEINMIEAPRNDYRIKDNRIEIDIYGSSLNQFIKDMKDNKYKLFVSYQLSYSSTVGYINSKRIKSAIFLNKESLKSISKLTIIENPEISTIYNYKYKLKKESNNKYSLSNRFDRSEIGIDVKGEDVFRYNKWGLKVTNGIYNRKELLKVLLFGYGMEIVLVIVVAAAHIKNWVRLPKGEYINNPDILIDPLLIESLIDRRIDNRDLITTCIIELIRKKNIENIDFDQIKLKSTSNLSDIERNVIVLLFVKREVFEIEQLDEYIEAQKELNAYIGKTIRISEINKSLIEDTEFAKFFNTKLKTIKKMIRTELKEKEYINYTWDFFLRFIKIIAYISIFAFIIIFAWITNANVLDYFFSSFYFLLFHIYTKKVFINNLTHFLAINSMAFVLLLESAIETMNYVYVLYLLFIVVLLLIGKACNTYVYTKVGKEEYKKAKMLKKYLIDYSLIKERDLDSIVVYDKFLVYATAFGITNNISKKISENIIAFNRVYNFFFGDVLYLATQKG